MFRLLSVASLLVSALTLFLPQEARADVAFKQNQFSINVPANTQYRLELKSLLSNVGINPLLWTVFGDVPAWLTFDRPNGIVSGNPTLANVGTKTFNVSVKEEGTIVAGAIAQVTLTVVSVPNWANNPIDFGTAFEGKDFSFDLNAQVSDPAQGPVTVSAKDPLSLPRWMTANGGILRGIPSREDVGAVTGLVFIARTNSGGVAEVVVNGRVEKTIHPPKWTAPTFNLGAGTEDIAFTANVSGPTFIVNDDSVPLTFEITQKTSDWLDIANSGILSGIPRRANINQQTVTIRLKGSSGADTWTSDAVFTVNIAKVNKPPVWKTPVMLPDAISKMLYTQDLTPFVTNVENLPLKFTIQGNPLWASVLGGSNFTGTPTVDHLGTNQFQVVVDDGFFQIPTTVTVNVKKRPPTWNANPIRLPDAKEDNAYTANVANQATDPDGTPLTFSVAPGTSTWITLTATGAITGMPRRGDVGQNSIPAIVTDGFGNSANTVLQIEVGKTNKPPTWQNVVMPDAPERKLYEVDLTAFAQNVDGTGALTFQKISGPAWIQLNANGRVSGTPQRADLGAVILVVRVTDTNGLTADKTLNFQVIKVPRPPEWLADPIQFSTSAREAFTQSIANQVRDLDSLPITIAKTSGPGWLTIESNGSIQGTPEDGDVGKNEFVVTATNSDGQSASVRLVVDVLYKIHPPVLIPNSMVFTLKERQVLDVNLNSPQYITNVDNLPLTFNATPGTWYTVSTVGALQLKPLRAQVGTHSIPVTITSGQTILNTSIAVTVEKDPRPPVWSEDPIVFTTKARESFTASVAVKVLDRDGLKLTITKSTGPAWLAVGSDGALSGNPGDTEVGSNPFTLIATNTDGQSAPVQLVVNVVHKPHPPVIVPNSMNFTLKEREELQENLAQAKFVTNVDGTPLTFVAPAASWYTLSPQGVLVLKPLRPQVGTQNIPVTVSTPTDSVQGMIVVTVVKDPRPPVWDTDPIRFTTKARELFTNTVKNNVKDLDGLSFQIKKVTGAAWLNVGTDGALSGTPQDLNVGENPFTLTATNADNQTATVNVIVTVVEKPHPPRWTQNPIQLPDGKAEEAYAAQNLVPFVTDIDPGLTLSFTKLGGPAWVQLSPAGMVTGTPQVPDVGLAQVPVRVTTSAGDSADTVVRIRVLPPPVPPKWKQDPIQLADATQEKPYNFSIAPFVLNPDNQPLTFRKIQGPAWLLVAADGSLSGTPTKADAIQGNYTAVFEVTDGKRPAQVGALGRVIRVWAPPVIASNIVFTVKERSTLQVSLNQPQFITNLEASPLSFLPVGFEDWLALSPTGELVLKPLFKHIGSKKFQFTVNDTHNAPVTGSFTVVVERDPRTPKWSQDPIRFNAKADAAFTAELRPFVSDLDGLPLTFRIQSGASWLSIDSATGRLSGTPAEENVGENPFVVEAKNDVLGQVVNVIITVKSGIEPPIWAKNPIRLPNAKATKAYTQDGLKTFVTDPNGLQLVFQKSAGPDWAFITSAGLVIGTPEEKDVGDNQFVVRATNTKGGFAEVTVMILVETAKVQPKWKQDPIPLGEAIVDAPFAFDLAPFVTDTSGAALSFRMLPGTGPAWLITANDGKLSGTPHESDLGEFTATFQVTNGQLSADVRAFGKVIRAPKPPVLNLGALYFEVRVGEIKSVNLNQPIYVTNPDQTTNPLTFALTNGQTWIQVSSAGWLDLRPLLPQLGDHSFDLVVTNNRGLSAQGPLRVKVLEAPKPPVWSDQVIRFETMVDQPFMVTILDYVTDPSGKPITLSKISGPAWLSVSRFGTLTGTPRRPDLGVNTFTINARNDVSGADVTVIITVKSNDPITDKIAIDQAVPGATAENLWVVDTSWPYRTQNKFIRAFSDALPTFYSKLDQAKERIRHTGVYISADVRYKGTPVEDRNGSALMRWDESDWVGKFRYRMNNQNDAHCYNSPILSMFQFYEKLSSLGISNRDWFRNEIPMDVLIVTRHVDYFRKFAKGTAVAGWDPGQFADNFISRHVPARKPYRINVTAPKCLSLLDPLGDPGTDPEHVAEENSAQAQADYRRLTAKTGGRYWPTDCGDDMKTILSEYADQIILRAYITGKNRIKLSKTPLDPSRIELKIAGKVVPGNTGNTASDLWTYDATTNEVVIRWDKMDLTAFKPGDIIEISYIH